jgi:hypothetical protein
MRNPPKDLEQDVSLIEQVVKLSSQLTVGISAVKDGTAQAVGTPTSIPLPPDKAYDEFLKRMTQSTGVGVSNLYFYSSFPTPINAFQMNLAKDIAEQRDKLVAAIASASGLPTVAATAITLTPSPETPVPQASVPTPTPQAPTPAPVPAPSENVPSGAAPSGPPTTPLPSAGTTAGAVAGPTAAYVAQRVGIFATDIYSIEPAPKVLATDPDYYVAKTYSGGNEVWYYFVKQPNGTWKFQKQVTKY